MVLLYTPALAALFGGIVAMAMAVLKAEAGAMRFSIALYGGSICLVLLGGKFASMASAS